MSYKMSQLEQADKSQVMQISRNAWVCEQNPFHLYSRVLLFAMTPSSSANVCFLYKFPILFLSTGLCSVPCSRTQDHKTSSKCPRSLNSCPRQLVNQKEGYNLFLVSKAFCSSWDAHCEQGQAIRGMTFGDPSDQIILSCAEIR